MGHGNGLQCAISWLEGSRGLHDHTSRSAIARGDGKPPLRARRLPRDRKGSALHLDESGRV